MNINQVNHLERAFYSVKQLDFTTNTPDSLFSIIKERAFIGRKVDFIRHIGKALEGFSVTFYSIEANVLADIHGVACILFLFKEEENSPVEELTHVMDVRIASVSDAMANLYTKLSDALPTDPSHVVQWAFTGSYGTAYRDVEIPPMQPSFDEFYPYISGGVDDFYSRYWNSASNVLILFGEPGTGKTTFIRNFIHKYKLKTLITYDEQVIAKESFFVDYILHETNNLLVLEDADGFLYNREKNENHVMSRLLNAADGLVKLPQKKIILTGNLTDLSQMDPALIRPGRCFDVVNFRELTSQEAEAAAKVSGIEGFTPTKKTYSIGEITNLATPNLNDQQKKNSVGFGFKTH